MRRTPPRFHHQEEHYSYVKFRIERSWKYVRCYIDLQIFNSVTVKVFSPPAKILRNIGEGLRLYLLRLLKRTPPPKKLHHSLYSFFILEWEWVYVYALATFQRAMQLLFRGLTCNKLLLLYW